MTFFFSAYLHFTPQFTLICKSTHWISQPKNAEFPVHIALHLGVKKYRYNALFYFVYLLYICISASVEAANNVYFIVFLFSYLKGEKSFLMFSHPQSFPLTDAVLYSPITFNRYSQIGQNASVTSNSTGKSGSTRRRSKSCRVCVSGRLPAYTKTKPSPKMLDMTGFFLLSLLVFWGVTLFN